MVVAYSWPVMLEPERTDFEDEHSIEIRFALVVVVLMLVVHSDWVDER